MSWQIQTPDQQENFPVRYVITTKLIKLNKRLIHALKSPQFCDVRNRDREKKRVKRHDFKFLCALTLSTDL